MLPGETIDLAKLIGACCTLVISHQQNMVGKTYASIDAVSKPTRKVAASGQYDPAAARQRYAEWKAKASATPANGGQRTEGGGQPGGAPQAAAVAATPANTSTKSTAATPPAADFDPEVGF